MAKKKITSITKEILKDYLPENGYSLYHAEFAKEGRDWFLRIFVDKEEGPMSTSDCETISRYLSDELDKANPIEQNYYLVVSSPGLDRELVTQEHYDRYTGSEVDISLYKAVNGEKTVTGILEGLEDGIVKIRKDDEITEFMIKEIAKTKLTVRI